MTKVMIISNLSNHKIEAREIKIWQNDGAGGEQLALSES